MGTPPSPFSPEFWGPQRENGDPTAINLNALIYWTRSREHARRVTSQVLSKCTVSCLNALIYWTRSEHARRVTSQVLSKCTVSCLNALIYWTRSLFLEQGHISTACCQRCNIKWACTVNLAHILPRAYTSIWKLLTRRSTQITSPTIRIVIIIINNSIDSNQFTHRQMV